MQYVQRKTRGEQILRARSAIIHMGQRTKKYLETTLTDTMSPQSNNYVILLQMALELKSIDTLLSSFQVRCPCFWESTTTSQCPYKFRRNRSCLKPPGHTASSSSCCETAGALCNPMSILIQRKYWRLFLCYHKDIISCPC